MKSDAQPSQAGGENPTIPQPGQVIWLMVANLNPSGLGYFLSRQPIKGIICLAAWLIVLAAGFYFNASRYIAIWLGLILLLILAAVLDFWLRMRKKPIVLTAVFQKSSILLPVLSLLVNVLFYGGFLAYRSMGSNLYLQGITAYENDDATQAFASWHTFYRYFGLSINPLVNDAENKLGEVGLMIVAEDHFQKDEYQHALDAIDQFTALYPASPLLEGMQDVGMQAYLSWADEFSGLNQHEAGLQKLKQAESAFPERISRFQKELDQAYCTNSKLWADDLAGKKDYARAIDKYENLMRSYPQADESKLAYELAANQYILWSEELAEKNDDYQQAVQKLEKVEKGYARSSAAQKVGELLPGIYLDWVGTLTRQNQYFTAQEKLDILGTMKPDSSTIRQIESEHDKIIQLLAQDDGHDGQMVLEEAIAQLCMGEAATHPSIGIFSEEEGKFALCYTQVTGEFDGIEFDLPEWTVGGEYSLPADLLTDKPGNLQYVIYKSDSSRRIQTCSYEDGYELQRIQKYTELVIKCVLSGDEVARKTFSGTAPETCPNKRAFAVMVEYQNGPNPDEETINNWLRQVVK